MKQKAIVFDAGSLITFSMNCALNTLRDLKKEFNGKFIITKEVEYEIITSPMSIKKYKLGAIRLKNLIDEKILEFPSSLGIKDTEIQKKSKEYLKQANNLLFKNDTAIHLIDTGEASCLALSTLLNKKGIENVITIDERTTRMLYENIENLIILLEKKLHTKIYKKQSKIIDNNFNFIRSSELIYVAFKKGLIKPKTEEMLDALLYGVKFKGCAISNDEIKTIERL